MATRKTMPGRLIAIDGADGGDVADIATTLVERLADHGLSAGISRWDASGLFADVVAAPLPHRDVSPRTLLLLYAADLAFRVRWEIAPALMDGHVVIAAPYVETAISFGTAAGLSREWLSTLLRFAPQAARSVVLKEPKRPRVWKRRPERGFAECCTTLLRDTPEGFGRKRTREAMVSALSTAGDAHGGVVRAKHLSRVVDELLKYPRPAQPRELR